MRFRLPPLRGNARAHPDDLPLEQAQGASTSPGGSVHDTATAGQGTDDQDAAGTQGTGNDAVWYLPTAPASGERNRYRVRGWVLATGLALFAWAVVAGVIVIVVNLVR